MHDRRLGASEKTGEIASHRQDDYLARRVEASDVGAPGVSESQSPVPGGEDGEPATEVEMDDVAPQVGSSSAAAPGVGSSSDMAVPQTPGSTVSYRTDAQVDPGDDIPLPPATMDTTASYSSGKRARDPAEGEGDDARALDPEDPREDGTVGNIFNGKGFGQATTADAKVSSWEDASLDELGWRCQDS